MWGEIECGAKVKKKGKVRGQAEGVLWNFICS